MRCARCDKGRPVDIINWNLAGACTYCKYGAKKQEVEEDEKQLARYRELQGILTDPGAGGDQTSQMPYDELSEWCAGEMEPVFSDRDVLYVQTLHYVHTLAVQNKRWEAAVTYGETILPAFR